MEIRDPSRLGKHGYLGGSSEFTPIVLLDSGHDFENLHRWLGYGGRCIPQQHIYTAWVIYAVYIHRNRLALNLAPPIKITHIATNISTEPYFSNTFGNEQVSRIPSIMLFLQLIDSKGAPLFSYVYVLLRRLRISHGFISFVSQTIDEAEVNK